MNTSPYRREIRQAAEPLGLDPRLVEAIIQVESSGNPWSWRPEPRYRWFWDVRQGRPFRALTPQEIADEDAPADFPCLAGSRDQEWSAQQASWGLMQVMGAVAREHGYRGPYLTELLQPATNVSIGARYFAALVKRAEGDSVRALAFWNGGTPGNEKPPYRNQGYVDKVLTALAQVS